MKERLKTAGMWLIVMFFPYLTVAQLVLAIRHPWMTKTERLIYTGSALTFSGVKYSEARSR